MRGGRDEPLVRLRLVPRHSCQFVRLALSRGLERDAMIDIAERRGE